MSWMGTKYSSFGLMYTLKSLIEHSQDGKAFVFYRDQNSFLEISKSTNIVSFVTIYFNLPINTYCPYGKSLQNVLIIITSSKKY